MKRTGKTGVLLLAACVLLLSGCEKEDHEVIAQPSPAALSAFKAQFPDAREVKWDKSRDYDVAEFSLAAPQRHTAWYAPGTGACALTAIDLSAGQLAEEAPAVIASWQTTPYPSAGYRPAGIGRLTYAGREPVYRLEIERGDAQRRLTYTADGTLLSDWKEERREQGLYAWQPCPQAVVDFIDTRYPRAVLADFEVENRQGVLYYEVGIFHRQEAKELLFDANYTFLVCVAGIEDPSLLPDSARSALLALAPDTGSWEELTRYEDYKGMIAAFVLKVADRSAQREKLFKVDPQGNPLE